MSVTTARSNSSIVNEILDYWFGGDLNSNYKLKWFPESNQQIIIDKEIYDKYSPLFHQAINNELSEWENNLYSNIALIVVLDQFSRHIVRYLSTNDCIDSNTMTTADLKSRADAMALRISQQLYSLLYNECIQLPMPYFIFSLMPLRHNSTITNLRSVLHYITTKEQHESKQNDLLIKFRKQTIRRLQHLEDREKVSSFKF